MSIFQKFLFACCARSAPLGRRSFLSGLLGGLVLVAAAGSASAKGGAPEDILKGTMIISDAPLPTRWTSPAEYAGRLRKLHKTSLNYDKKTGKVQVYYAAFFASPIDDVQVNFVIHDITNGVASKAQKGSWEAFLGRRGERVLFNSVELDKEDLEMNKKYLFTIEYKRQILAKSELVLRGEAPKYSGKVEFTDEETKKKQ
jgi:hypothetical protein